MTASYPHRHAKINSISNCINQTGFLNKGFYTLPVSLFYYFCISCSVLGKALLCNKCRSSKSWEDCHEHRLLLNCSRIQSITFDVCLKVHMVQRQNGTELHSYAKNCGAPEMCSGDECIEHGDWCQVDCCNVDKCNKSGSIKVSYMIVGVLIAFKVILSI